MTQFSGLDAQQAIVSFLIENDATCLPEQALSWIRDAVAQSDGLTMVVRTMETLYAYREECPEGHNLCGDLAEFVSQHNFWGLGGLDGRATKIHSTMLRVLDGGALVAEGDIERSPTAAPPLVAETVAEPPVMELAGTE